MRRTLRRALPALLALLVAGAGVAVALLRPHPRDVSTLAVEWRPAVALASGVSAREGRVDRGGTWRAIDVSVDLAKAELRVASAPHGAPLEQLIPPEAVAAFNGGFFDAHFHPTGWLVDQGTELAPKQSRDSGGLLAIRGAELFIGPLADLELTPELALQNSPRLVEAEGQIGIHGDDGRRAARTAACDAAGRLHLVEMLAPEQDGPTLLELARWLALDPARGGLGCTAALNLDGGPSTGVWFAPTSGLASSPPRAPIAYALAVVPRQ